VEVKCNVFPDIEISGNDKSGDDIDDALEVKLLTNESNIFINYPYLNEP
jgi:hypothetical protein